MNIGGIVCFFCKSKAIVYLSLISNGYLFVCLDHLDSYGRLFNNVLKYKYISYMFPFTSYEEIKRPDIKK